MIKTSNHKVVVTKQVSNPFYQNKLRKSRTCKRIICQQQNQSDKGLGVLEWTGGLISQGTLVKGVKGGWRVAWQTMMKELAPQSSKGEYKRPKYSFMEQIGQSPQFPNEHGRYHVYVGNACPWCHKVLLVLAITGAANGYITYSMLQDDAERASRGGWVFDEKDPVFGAKDLRQVYDICNPGYTGRCTAPLMVDRKSRKIVCNESSIIIRNICSLSFKEQTSIDLFPNHLQDQITLLEEKIYNGVNNAVYRSGFSTSQAAYDQAQKELYSTLQDIDQKLSSTKFLLGDKVTIVDLQLYPTIARFDSAYAVLFKCSRKRIQDYPNISRWFGDIYNLHVPQSALQVKDTYSFEEGRQSYFSQLFPLNPGGIVPSGPTFDDIYQQYLIPAEESQLTNVFYSKNEETVAAL